MSEVLDDIAQDAVEAMSAPRVRRRKSDSQNPIVNAMSNGAGLIMTRVSILLITILLGVIGWAGNNLLTNIDGHLADLKNVVADTRSIVTGLQIDVAVLKQHNADQDSGKK